MMQTLPTYRFRADLEVARLDSICVEQQITSRTQVSALAVNSN